MKIYNVLGIMSGSSLDGVDLAFCEFTTDDNGTWKFEIIKAETLAYENFWITILKDLPFSSGKDLVKYDIKYGKYLAGKITSFLSKHKLTPDFIASHGHTIFHRPADGYTFQLGNGQALASATGLTVISDFRTKDIQHGGQGAPLVPVGDELLFNEYDACLNLGGIANISFTENHQRKAFDICPANQLLNHLASQMKIDYDEDGNLAKSGEVNNKLFDLLNADNYYDKNYPKSLGNEYVRDHFIPLLDGTRISLIDKLATVVEHIAFQIGISTVHLQEGKILVTGGGTHNSYLMDRLGKLTKQKFVIPNEQLIDFKEALIFAFMGVLRMRNEINCIASVTGAIKDCSGGVIFYP